MAYNPEYGPPLIYSDEELKVKFYTIPHSKKLREALRRLAEQVSVQTLVYSDEKLKAVFKESDHPRGQPENPGRFRKKEKADVKAAEGKQESADTKPETAEAQTGQVKLPEYVNKEQEKSNKFFADYVINKPAARAAVKSYTNDGQGIGHTLINNALLGREPMTPALKRHITELEKLTEAYRLDKDITVYRGTSAKHFTGGWDIGKPQQLKMFTSTSANILDAERFAKENPQPLIVEMRVAKGTKGMYIGENTFFKKKGKKQNEYEFLLGSGLKYTVISKDTKDGRPYWIMEVRNE